MYIDYKNNKLKKICEDFTRAKKEWGPQIGRKLIQRLNEIQAADCVADLNHQPPTRCHKLSNDRKYQYAVDLVHPFRLIFEPINEDGSLFVCDDPKQITRVKILEVVNYHG